MKLKRALTMLLVSIMMITFFIPNALASEVVVTDSPLPEIKEGYNRYFFLANDSWFNEYTNVIGIYWWEGTGACEEWPGYIANKADAEKVYYYDVPEDVTDIIWNNYLVGITDTYSYEMRTGMMGVVGDFDGKIAVARTEWIDNFDQYWPPCDWYYYYGGGCYGDEKNGDYTNCLCKDHEHYLIGDVDMDGVVTILDATYIQRVLASIDVFTDGQKVKSDVDDDGEVTIIDATAIQLYIAKLETVY